MPENNILTVDSGVSEITLQQVVIRCGCGNPSEIHPSSVCPTPRATEDLGVTASYKKKLPKRSWWKFMRF